MLNDVVRFTHHRPLGVPEGERVTLVVFSWQRVAQLESLLHALRCQTHPNFKCVVVHDGPDPAWSWPGEWVDHMRRSVGDDWRFDFVVHPEHVGDWGYPARRAYEASVDGEWVGELCDDDWVAPTYLEQLLHAALSNNAQVAYCDYIHNFTNWGAHEAQFKSLHIGIGGWIVRREVALAHDYPRPIHFTSDGERIDKMAAAGVTSVRVPAYLFCHG